MKKQPTCIVIIDDHEMVREGLRAFLAHEQDLAIVGEAQTAAGAVTLVDRLKPNLALLDMKLPDASGADTCRRLLAVAPQLRILVLTNYEEDATVVTALQSGAHGYLLKDVRMEELVGAIRTVAQGRGYLDSRITQQALHWMRTGSHPGGYRRGITKLSPQERLIMPLLAEGKTNKEIAMQLHLSDKTIKNYLANIFSKLQVKRRTEAVSLFVKESPSANLEHNT